MNNPLVWTTSPLVYFMTFLSQFIGFVFATHWLVSETESILYQTGTLIDRELWGVLLLATASLLQLGLCTNNRAVTFFGGMGGFMLWLSASLDLAVTGNWYILITVGLLHTLFHAYVYLSHSLGYLEKIPRSSAL